MEETMDEEPVKLIQISSSNVDIVVKTVEGISSPKFYFVKEFNDEVTMSKKDGVFSIVHHQRFPGFFFFNWHHHDPMELSLPLTYTGSLDLKTNNGKIKISGVHHLSSLSIKSDNGSSSLTECSAQCLVVTSKNGGIHLDNVEATSLEVSSSNARIRAEQVIGKDKVSMRSNNGSLSLEALASPLIALQTKNGSIKGTILGQESDYSILSHSINGASNLRSCLREDNKKRLSVSTSNGSISLNFCSDN